MSSVPSTVSRFLSRHVPTGDWIDRARCGGRTLGILSAFDEITEEQACGFCKRCPVRGECLAAALEFEDREDLTMVAKDYPVLGGLTGRERAEILRARRPRRPRLGGPGVRS